MERYKDIMELLETAECRLENIQGTTTMTMHAIVGSPASTDPEMTSIYHILAVMKDSMDALRFTLDEIGDAAMLGLKQPA